MTDSKKVDLFEVSLEFEITAFTSAELRTALERMNFMPNMDFNIRLVNKTAEKELEILRNENKKSIFKKCWFYIRSFFIRRAV